MEGALKKINLTIYNEFCHERIEQDVAAVYPNGIHKALAAALETEPDVGEIVLATLEDHKTVLTHECLDATDVLFWWGHMRH